MPFCTHCGQKFDDHLSTCPYCGADNKAKTSGSSSEFDVRDIFNTEDSTTSMDVSDIRANRGITILAYIGPLVFIPFFSRKDSRFARYHSVRGMNLFILQAVFSVALTLISSVLSDNIIGNFLSWIISTPVELAMLALSVIGIINVARGKCRELPVIGKIKFVK